jgi:DNA-binding response OmpR family regulator
MTKVLVAEDDRFLMSAYKVKFVKAGFDIMPASDGAEVLELLKNDQPDIILLDLIMPGKDGFAVLEELKRSEKLRVIPVIVASNLGQKEDLDRALNMGADDYIVKSDLSMDDLVNKVKAVVKSGKVKKESS